MKTGNHADHCPHCGGALGAPDAQARESVAPVRYDLEELAALAQSEKAYDETVKVRVTQDDIRKLVEKRRRKPR